MTLRISIHHPKSMKANGSAKTWWLDIVTFGGGEATIFAPLDLVERLEQAFHDWEDEVSGRETAPVSDDTDAVTDLPRQRAETMALK